MQIQLSRFLRAAPVPSPSGCARAISFGLRPKHRTRSTLRYTVAWGRGGVAAAGVAAGGVVVAWWRRAWGQGVRRCCCRAYYLSTRLFVLCRRRSRREASLRAAPEAQDMRHFATCSGVLEASCFSRIRRE